MRLSTVFELLLIFLLIAFAAYGRVIDRDEVTLHGVARAANLTRQVNTGVQVMSLKQATENVNRYCTCNTNICNCCRNFNIPIVQLKGPGCASLQYLESDKLAVQLSMGENILTSTVINGQKPRAVCFPMPGGLTKFCGRIYSIQREADNHFKACLALELQSSAELEAALRVSCFRFGPDGVKLRPAEELPIVQAETATSDDDDDDDDDIFGLGSDDDEDDDDDEEDDTPEGNAVPDSSAANDEEDEDDDDILGFSAFIDILTGADESNKKKKPSATTVAPILPFTIPILTKPTIISPSPIETFNNPKPIPTTSQTTLSIPNVSENALPVVDVSEDSDKFHESSTPQISEIFSTEEIVLATEAPVSEESVTQVSVVEDNIAPADSNNIEYVAKPEKPLSSVKIIPVNKNKPSLTSNSINAIQNDSKKPSLALQKPIKPDPVQASVQAPVQSPVQNLQHEESEEDDDILNTSDLDDDDEDDEKLEHENESATDENEDEKIESNEDEDEKVENHQDDEDDDDEELIASDEDEEESEEEEDAALTALVDDDNDQKIKNKVADNEASHHEEDDSDYSLSFAELLARKRPARSGRQSKVMRL